METESNTMTISDARKKVQASGFKLRWYGNQYNGYWYIWDMETTVSINVGMHLTSTGIDYSLSEMGALVETFKI